MIESIFGVSVSLDGSVTAKPIVAALDPPARLFALILEKCTAFCPCCRQQPVHFSKINT